MMLITLSILTMLSVYFVPLAELKIKDRNLGKAAGSLSVIRFLPDALLYTFFGNFLDEHPGKAGYKLIFGSLAGFAVSGIICSMVLFQKIKVNLN